MNTEKLPLTAEERKAQEFIVRSVENALDALSKHYAKYCNEVAPKFNGGNPTTFVPLSYINESHKIFIDNYRKSARQAATGEVE